jgi:hypothetical protein
MAAPLTDLEREQERASLLESFSMNDSPGNLGYVYACAFGALRAYVRRGDLERARLVIETFDVYVEQRRT